MALWDQLTTRRYAPLARVIPSPQSIREKFPLVKNEHRAGFDYEFPLIISGSQGITRQSAQFGSATLNTPIPPTTAQAIITVPNMYNSERIDNATIMRSMNGVNQSGQAGAYFDAIDFHVEEALKGHENQLDIDYFHGAGTGASVADHIGQVGSATGTNLGTAGYKVRFLAASWSEGVWNTLTNALCDIYAADGTTVVATGVTCTGVTDETKNEVGFFKTGSAATVAATNKVVLSGSLGGSIYGVGALLTNATSLFNINAGSVNFWKARSFDAGAAPFTSAKLLQATARLQAMGADQGLTGYLHPLGFNDIVAERDALVKYNDGAKNVEIGTDTIRYITAAGPVELKRSIFQKQGQAYFVNNEDTVSVGSALPMLVGSDGSGPVVQRVAGTTSHECQTMSSCGPLFRKPARNLLVFNIASTGQTTHT